MARRDKSTDTKSQGSSSANVSSCGHETEDGGPCSACVPPESWVAKGAMPRDWKHVPWDILEMKKHNIPVQQADETEGGEEQLKGPAKVQEANSRLRDRQTPPPPEPRDSKSEPEQDSPNAFTPINRRRRSMSSSDVKRGGNGPSRMTSEIDGGGARVQQAVKVERSRITVTVNVYVPGGRGRGRRSKSRRRSKSTSK